MDVGNSSSSKMDKYWVDSPNQCHYDRNLNFAAIGSEDEEAYSNFSKKTKSARDPQSHRIIEKRRRDRMNNCLADLSRLLPSAYMKKGRGRIEKTEIIEMTIKHMKHLQVHACKEMESCDIAVQMEQLHSNTKSDQYRSGFLECITETVQFIEKGTHHVSFFFRSNNHQQQHSNDNRPTRTSSGSGGDSDESRSNRATRNSDTPSPVNPTTDGSSPTDMDNSSHSGGSNHSSSRSGTSSSQLRQMLLSNSESSRTKSCSSSSQCSSRSNTTQHSSTDDSNSVYKKFKTNIHQRFTADLEHVFPQSSCVMTPSSGSSSSNSLPEQQTQQPSHHSLIERNFEQFHGLKRKKSDGDIHRHANSRYGWNGDIPPPPPPSSPTTRGQRLHSGEIDDPYTIDHTAMQQEQQQSANLQIIQPAENVPIFALHPKGAFYVPMSVELSLVRALFNPPSSSNNAQPLLHPVTISVNFGHPSRVLTAATVADTVEKKAVDTPTDPKAVQPESTLSSGRHANTVADLQP
nr:EOG090X0J7Y [Daphnia magna]